MCSEQGGDVILCLGKEVSIEGIQAVADAWLQLVLVRDVYS